MNTWLFLLKDIFSKENLMKMIGYLLIVVPIVVIALALLIKPAPAPDTLKDFKDGIQNHLVWSIKGECFFVRPHAETTVYLIRVADCDKK
jgi:ABC-type spermidine/putrescine transport system permease subunit II